MGDIWNRLRKQHSSIDMLCLTLGFAKSYFLVRVEDARNTWINKDKVTTPQAIFFPSRLHLSVFPLSYISHDDVIKWKHFPRYWPFVWEIHRSPVNSPHKGQWRGASMFSLICTWINDWLNNREAGDLIHYHAHYDVTVMFDFGNTENDNNN